MSRNPPLKYMVDLKQAFQLALDNGLGDLAISLEIKNNISINEDPVYWSHTSIKGIREGLVKKTRHDFAEIEAIVKYFNDKFRIQTETNLAAEQPQIVIALNREEALALAMGIVSEQDLAKIVKAEIHSKINAQLESFSKPQP